MTSNHYLIAAKPSQLGWLSRVLAMTSVILIGISLILYQDTTKRMSELQTGVKEDSLWAIYQLDRSNRELLDKLEALSAGESISPKDVGLAYDILWSRADLLTKNTYLNAIRFDPELTEKLLGISNLIKNQSDVFDQMVKAQGFDEEQLSNIVGVVHSLNEQGYKILIDANSAISVDRANSRLEISKRHNLSIKLFFALVFNVVVLVLLLYRQISETVKASQRIESMATELQKAYEAAESGNWAKTRFLATVSHEIRTPLNSILGLSDIILDQSLEQVIRDDVSQIRDSGVFLLDILNEVLDYSSLESGNMNFATQLFDLRDFMKKTVAVFEANASKKGLKVQLEFLSEAPGELWIETDPTRLRQLLMNFISNAIKFTENGSVRIFVSLTKKQDKSADLFVSVSDTGTGIRPDSLNKLFQPFSQVDASVSRRFGGTGLGLAISKGIAEKMGGSIGVESTLGVGSNFFVSLPVKCGQAAKAAHAEVSLIEKNEKMPTRILVVDDNSINLRVMQRRLATMCHQVDTVASGAAALTLCDEGRFDLIFMDMQMPEMSGIETAAILRASDGPNSETPIFALTANAAPDDKRACLAAGMDGFEVKPLSSDRIRKILRSIHNQNTHQMELVSQSDPVPQLELNVRSLAPDQERVAELIDEIGQESFFELWDAFCSEANLLLTGVRKDLEAGLLVETRAKLHTLKGAAANIGLTSVATLADHMRTLNDESAIAGELVHLTPLEDGTLRRHFSNAA